MNREDIDRLLAGEKNEALEAHSEIVSIQKDKSNILKIGQEWADANLVAGLNNKMIFFGSRPSNGKTYHCSQTINNLLNKELNPIPLKILRLNLEMPTSALLLREVSKVLGRKPSDILKEPYSEFERPKVKSVVESFMDERVTNVSATLKGEDFKYMLEKFIKTVDEEDELHNTLERAKLAQGKTYTPRKTKKIILVDHLHIYLSKEVIDTILLICNELKMADRNLSFIFYFQLNRTVEDLWRETKEKKINPKNMLPNATYIYQTDILQQVADMVVAMVIPQIYDLDEFAAIHVERNSHLKEHFSDNTDSSFSRVKGRNRIYYNIIKLRMLDSFDDPRLFCEVLNPAHEEAAEKIVKQNNSPTFSTPIPVFESPVAPNFDLKNAFNDDPF